eukprot:m.75779 g.75779  ORF g.75779 m.75779 type:complete len:239 (+) comp14493_c2_seq1:68-784(+)
MAAVSHQQDGRPRKSTPTLSETMTPAATATASTTTTATTPSQASTAVVYATAWVVMAVFFGTCEPHGWRTLWDILTYDGSVLDCAINYVLLALSVCTTILLATSLGPATPTFRWPWWFFALCFYQIGLCYLVQCVGVSIVWNAVASWMYSEAGRTAGQATALVAGAAGSLLALSLAVDVYYCITDELLTTVAHMLSLLLGLVVYLLDTRMNRSLHSNSRQQQQQQQDQRDTGNRHCFT